MSGISARTAGIGPKQITNPLSKNLDQAIFAMSAEASARTKTATKPSAPARIAI